MAHETRSIVVITNEGLQDVYVEERAFQMISNIIRWERCCNSYAGPDPDPDYTPPKVELIRIARAITGLDLAASERLVEELLY